MPSTGNISATPKKTTTAVEEDDNHAEDAHQGSSSNSSNNGNNINNNVGGSKTTAKMTAEEDAVEVAQQRDGRSRSNDNGANNNKDNNKKGEGSKKETSATVSLADAQKQWNQQIKQKQKALQKTARPQQQGQQVLRRGHWTPEEEVYAEKLIQEFKSGLLPLPAGTSLRTYLATLLNCDPMRISKKFEGPNCIGKQKYERATTEDEAVLLQQGRGTLTSEQQKQEEQVRRQLVAQYISMSHQYYQQQQTSLKKTTTTTKKIKATTKTTKKENGNDYSSLQKKQKQSTKKKSLLSSSSLSLSLSPSSSEQPQEEQYTMVYVQVPFEELLDGNRMVIDIPGRNIPFEISVPLNIAPGTILPVQVPMPTGMELEEEEKQQHGGSKKRERSLVFDTDDDNDIDDETDNDDDIDDDDDDDDDAADIDADADADADAYMHGVIKKEHQKKKKKSKGKKRKQRKVRLTCDDTDWMNMFHLLVAYHKKHGTTRVYRSYIDTDTNLRLGYWVHEQADNYRRLEDDKKRILKAIKFDYQDQPSRKSRKEYSWMAWYESLREFYEKNNTTLVTTKLGGDKGLMQWVSRQRYMKDKLKEDQMKLLNDINFVFESTKVRREAKWMDHYQNLIRYMEEHDGSMDGTSQDHPELNSWIKNQKSRNSNGTLSQERIDLLNEINFVWVHKLAHGRNQYSNRHDIPVATADIPVTVADIPVATAI